MPARRTQDPPGIKEYVARSGRKTYRVRVRHNGRQTSETFLTREAARVFALDVAGHGVDYAIRMRDQADLERGHTLDQALDDFIAWKTPRVRSDRTIRDYRRDYDRSIRPALGSRPVASLTRADVREWVDQLVELRLSPKSVADRHALLHSVVRHARTRGWIAADPCADTALPPRVKGQPKGLRPGEWQALHAALTQIDQHAADLAAFMLGTGWRWSEATALSTYDVEDYDTAMWVTVTQVMRRPARGRAALVQDGKSAAALRRVQVDPETAAIVRRRVADAAPGGLVFRTRTGYPWHHSNFRARAWEPAVAAANLNRHPTPHWLRHTHVAWLALTHQVSMPELSARLGHASIQTTIDVYGRMIADVEPAALAAFAAMRSGRPLPAGLGAPEELPHRQS